MVKLVVVREGGIVSAAGRIQLTTEVQVVLHAVVTSSVSVLT